MKRIFFSVLMAMACTGPLFAQTHQEKINVYLLGTFHFDQTDSTYRVLDDKHQKSINQLNDIIVGIKPDKIFIERMPDFENEHKMDSLYTAYVNRTKETNNPNEIWQVAFKTAKRLGHKKLYQCDHPGNYGNLYAEIQEYAKKHNQMNILEYHAPGVTTPLGSTVNRDSVMKSMSLLDFMKWLNRADVQSTSHAHYINVFPQVGHTDVYDYKENYLLGTELTADWYRRNIYIYSKMINQLDYKEKAIFLLIGNDHIPIIRHLFESNPYFKVVDTKKWLE
ncbi:MAG: hypothetical protein IPI11_02380 [Haliscomenobacter sp.]|nr:hypothetical protein [Haliscomenobacter sp.]